MTSTRRVSRLSLVEASSCQHWTSVRCNGAPRQPSPALLLVNDGALAYIRRQHRPFANKRKTTAVTIYDLYLESGPKKKTTMVHVTALAGCIATGSTTEAALAATPDAIRRFRHFLHRHGETIDINDPIETRIAEHVTEGAWLGNGSPYLMLETDLALLDEAEIATLLARLEWMFDALAAWTATQADTALDTDPGKGRTAREIVLHVIGAQGAALAYALGSAPGFGKIKSAAERGELPLAEALDRTMTLVRETIAPLTPDERNAIRELSSGHYNLRKALRRSLEHLWEHLAELSRRPDGLEI